MRSTHFEQGNCAAYQTQLSILPIPNKEFNEFIFEHHLNGKHVEGQLGDEGAEPLPDEARQRFGIFGFEIRFSIVHVEKIDVKRSSSDNEQRLTEFEGN